jgi:hypothetical protein
MVTVVTFRGWVNVTDWEWALLSRSGAQTVTRWPAAVNAR